MGVDRWGRPDQDVTADRLDEQGVERSAGQARTGESWADPRSWLPPEDRLKYYRRHEPMSEQELARLEAERAEQDDDLDSYTSDRDEDFARVEEADQREDAGRDEGTVESPPSSDAARAEVHEKGAEPSEEPDHGLQPSDEHVPSKEDSETIFEGEPSQDDDVGESGSTHLPAQEREQPTRPEASADFPGSKAVYVKRAELEDDPAAEPDPTGEELLELSDDESSRAREFGRRYFRSAEDVKDITDDVAEAVSGLVRPTPTGSGTVESPYGYVREQHPSPAEAGSVLTGLVGLGVLLHQAARLGWQYGRRTIGGGDKDAGDQ